MHGCFLLVFLVPCQLWKCHDTEPNYEVDFVQDEPSDCAHSPHIGGVVLTYGKAIRVGVGSLLEDTNAGPGSVRTE